MKIQSIIAALPFLTSTAVIAQSKKDWIGNDMYQPCKNSLDDHENRDHIKQGKCIGLMGALFFVSSELPDDSKFCPLPGSDSKQATRILLLYLDRHPDQLHRSILHLSLEALHAAWPCKD